MFIQALVILIMLFKHNLSLNMYLWYLYNSLSKPGVDELLHLVIALVNSSENGSQMDVKNSTISLRISSFIWQYWAILKNKCKAC